jgi:hypothetical protein
MCLARGNPSRAGCGGGLSRIAYLRNWALDSAISRRHTEDSSFDTLALESDVCLVRGPKLSWMRRWGALHCAFRQMGPRKGDVHRLYIHFTLEVILARRRKEASESTAGGELGTRCCGRGPTLSHIHI